MQKIKDAIKYTSYYMKENLKYKIKNQDKKSKNK